MKWVILIATAMFVQVGAARAGAVKCVPRPTDRSEIKCTLDGMEVHGTIERLKSIVGMVLFLEEDTGDERPIVLADRNPAFLNGWKVGDEILVYSHGAWVVSIENLRTGDETRPSDCGTPGAPGYEMCVKAGGARSLYERELAECLQHLNKRDSVWRGYMDKVYDKPPVGWNCGNGIFFDKSCHQGLSCAAE